MSSGGSNYSTGATGGGGNQVRIDSPASQGGYGIAPPVNNSVAPGGKGGFPSVQNPYQQQQPQMYMPPQQPSFYQQAFTQPRMQPPQMQYGLGGLRQDFNNARPELRSRQLGLNREVARPSPYQSQFPVGPTPPQMGNALQDSFGGYFQPGKGSVASPQFSEPDPNAISIWAGGSPVPLEPRPDLAGQSPPREIDYSSMPVGVMGGGDEYWRPGGLQDQQAEATRRWQESQGLRPNPNYNPAMTMQDNVPLPGSSDALARQQFMPITDGRGRSSFNPYSEDQAQLLALQRQGQQPFVETDDDFNKRIAKREADYYADMERVFGKERANELRKIEGPINFAAGSTRGIGIGGIG